MRDFFELKKGLICWSLLVRCSITKVAGLFGFSRTTLSRNIMQFKKQHQASSNGSNSGRSCKPTDMDRRALERNVAKHHRTITVKVFAELNIRLNSPVSTKTVRREPHKAGYHGKAAVRELLLSTHNIQKRWKDHNSWHANQWKQVIFLDESSFSLVRTSGRVYVWRKPKEAFNPDCFFQV